MNSEFPAIILLLPVGFAAGALTTVINPDKLFGAAFPPLVSLAVPSLFGARRSRSLGARGRCQSPTWRSPCRLFADYDPTLLRRALLGEARSGSAGRDLLADAIECAEDESGG